MINADWLSAFAVFAEELHFTRAARRLHLSQPALHVKVRKLGEALGMPLYRRAGRGVELTSAGHRCLAFARELEDRSTAFLGDIGKPVAERVVLAAGEGTLLHLLGPALRKVAHSRAKLRVLVGDRDATCAAVASGAAHLGVAPLETEPDGLKLTLLRKVGFKLVLPQAHPLATKRRIRLGDLEGARLIVPPPDRPLRREVERILGARGVNWELAVEATGWEVMQHLAMLGVGLAIVSDFCRLPKGAVARPLPDFAPMGYALVERAGAELPEPARRLRELVMEAFEKERVS